MELGNSYQSYFSFLDMGALVSTFSLVLALSNFCTFWYNSKVFKISLKMLSFLFCIIPFFQPTYLPNMYHIWR